MRRLLFISLGLLVTIPTLWYFALGRPADGRIASLKDDLRREQEKLDRYHRVLAEIDKLMVAFNDSQSNVGSYGSGYSGEVEIISLYNRIDSLCNRPGYSLREITPSLQEVLIFLRQWKSGEAVISLPITIRIEGEFKPLAMLIKEIEASRYFDGLVSCRLTGSDKLYPDCGLEIVFSAELINAQGMPENE